MKRPRLHLADVCQPTVLAPDRSCFVNTHENQSDHSRAAHDESLPRHKLKVKGKRLGKRFLGKEGITSP